MIISKTPYRISFFGGGTDYPIWYKKYGGEVISATINKNLYLTVRKSRGFSDHKYRIVYSKVEATNNLNKIKFKIVRKIIKSFNINHGLEIHYDGDLPAKSGIGSSSSFVVGLLNTFYLLKKNKILNKNQLAEESLKFEHKILKEVVGSQDQIAVSYGGFNSIKFYKNEKFLVSRLTNDKKFIDKLSENLVLVFTGVHRKASVVANNYIYKLNYEKKKEMFQLLELVKEAKKIINNKDQNNFGKLLHESWRIKKSVSKHISNTKIDELYETAIKHGAVGGKLLGAGGGGFFLFYVPKNKKKNFFKNNKKIKKINFKITNEGSSIIYKS